MASPNRLRASVIDLTFIMWALTVPLLLRTRVLNGDGDFPRHVTMGEFILHGGIGKVDSLAYTHTGPFLTTEWLSQVALALTHRIGGVAGVAVLAGILMGLTYALLVFYMRRQGVETFLAFATGVVAAMFGAVHWVARPHLFTFLALVVLLHLASRETRWWLYLLFFVVWANFHSGFVLGLVLLTAMAAGDLVEWRLAADPGIRGQWLRRARHHGGGVLAGALGASLNPMGPGLLFRIRHILGNQYLLSNTAEFLPIDFHGWYGRAFLVLILLILTALTLRPRRLSAPTLFVVCLMLAGALVSRRNMPLFALVALPLLAVEFDSTWRSLRVPGMVRMRAVFEEGERIALPGRLAPWCAALLLALGLSHGSVAGARLVPDDFDARRFPVEAVHAARAANLEGRIYNQFIWGGYLVYAWPEQRIFIDGMTDFLGNDVLRSYIQIERLDTGWEEELERWGVNVVIMPPKARLVSALRSHGGWLTWYEDETAAILVQDRVRP